ncbi:MAG: T9SS type A sorting domain-containing protein [Paludibacter sp.]|nr:T9SS type A sorting domain-containing protein [Paludibacter sp.]
MNGGKIRGYAKNSTCVLLATDGGIFKTTDSGQNWSNVSQTFNSYSLRCNKIVNIGNDFYAQSDFAYGVNICKSSDNGQNWTELPSSIGTDWRYQSFGKLNNDLYVIGIDYMHGTGQLYSSPDGAIWTPKAVLWTNFQQNGNVELLSFNQNRLYVYSQNNLYYTTDGSVLTTVSVTGLGVTSFSNGGDAFQGDAQGNLYFKNDNGGSVYKYNFTTESWTDIITGKIPVNYSIMEFSATDNALFIVAWPPVDNLKIYKSTDHGATFIQQMATGLTMDVVSNIIEASANVFIGNGLYTEILVSTTGGSTWSVPSNQFNASDAGYLTISGNTLLYPARNRGIVVSTNQGVSWNTGNGGIPGMNGVAYFVNEIISAKDTLFSLLQPDPNSDNVTLYKSTNNGISWNASPIPAPYSSGNSYTFAGKCDSALFVNYYDPTSSKYALIVTFNNGRTWVNPASQNSTQLTYLKGSKNCLFAFYANRDVWNDFNNVYKVNNFGVSFTDINPTNPTNQSKLFNDNFMIKRVENGQGGRGEAIMDFDRQNNKAIFAVNDRTNGEQDRLYLYNITSNVWSELITTGLPLNYMPKCIKSIGNNTWLLATNLGLYKSTDNGVNWTLTHLANNWLKGINVICIQLLNNQVFLGTTADGIWTVNLSTGAVEPLADKVLVAYPNPTANSMQVTIPDFNGMNAMVSLYSMDGKVMITKTANSKLYQLDMHNLPSGTYLLVINSNNRLYRKSVIRN